MQNNSTIFSILLEKYKGRGVRIIVFESEYATTRKEVV